MNAEQARAARSILKLGVREVGEATGVTPNTVSRIEAPTPEGKRGPQATTVSALRTWYETQGIQFLDADDTAQGPGVALKDGAGKA